MYMYMYVVVCVSLAQVVLSLGSRYIVRTVSRKVTCHVWFCNLVVRVFLFCKTGLSGHGQVVCVCVELVISNDN